jgi:hypothetical protein
MLGHAHHQAAGDRLPRPPAPGVGEVDLSRELALGIQRACLQDLQDVRCVRYTSPMATTQTSARADVVRTLPTYQEAAELIEIHPSGITRAVTRLGIEPQLWGGIEKHLKVVDVLRIAAQARRASVEEVAGGLLERASSDPSRQAAVRGELDRYFAEVHQPAQPSPRDQFLADLREALPGKYAKQAEHIYRRYVESS